MNSILGKEKYGNYTNIKNEKKKMNKLLFDLHTKENKIQDIICWKRISELKKQLLFNI